MKIFNCSGRIITLGVMKILSDIHNYNSYIGYLSSIDSITTCLNALTPCDICVLI